jgi:hypothetical protein
VNKPEKTSRNRKTWKAVGRVALYLLYVLILLELFSRAFLGIRYEASFFMPGDYIYHFYPELKNAIQELKNSEYSDFRLLILGGSVISHRYCPIDSVFRDRLMTQTNRPVQVYNLAVEAHTTLDSYYKYRRLNDYRLDLVVIYQSINELRTNNCPPEMYRDDYSHYAWYDELNTFQRHPEMSWVAFPVVCHQIYNVTREMLGLTEYLPRHAPSKEMVQYGTNIRSAQSFRHNLSAIIEIARGKWDKVLLMTFAYYLPPDYDSAKFDQKLLDYADHMYPVELWGSLAAVRQGLEAHNKVLRELGKAFPEVLLIDQDSMLVKNDTNFRDVCHLTVDGGIHLVDNLRFDLPDFLWPEH